jgi:hypothetical protein
VICLNPSALSVPGKNPRRSAAKKPDSINRSEVFSPGHYPISAISVSECFAY